MKSEDLWCRNQFIDQGKLYCMAHESYDGKFTECQFKSIYHIKHSEFPCTLYEFIPESDPVAIMTTLTNMLGQQKFKLNHVSDIYGKLTMSQTVDALTYAIRLVQDQIDAYTGKKKEQEEKSGHYVSWEA